MTSVAATTLDAESGSKMSLGEARQVRWLRSRPRPLGDLLDEGYLDTSRLQWAAEKAWDPRLKEAARVILDSQEPHAAPRPRSRKPRSPAPW
jgi:hypothetical protein